MKSKKEKTNKLTVGKQEGEVGRSKNKRENYMDANINGDARNSSVTNMDWGLRHQKKNGRGEIKRGKDSSMFDTVEGKVPGGWQNTEYGKITFRTMATAGEHGRRKKGRVRT